MSHGIPVLGELLALAGASLAVVMLFRRLRLPAAIGFIVTGVLIGPGGFRLVGDQDWSTRSPISGSSCCCSPSGSSCPSPSWDALAAAPCSRGRCKSC